MSRNLILFDIFDIIHGSEFCLFFFIFIRCYRDKNCVINIYVWCSRQSIWLSIFFELFLEIALQWSYTNHAIFSLCSLVVFLMQKVMRWSLMLTPITPDWQRTYWVYLNYLDVIRIFRFSCKYWYREES